MPISFTCPFAEVSSPPKDLTSQGDNVKLDLTAGDGIWDPTFVKVKAGAKVSVAITGGIGPHTFTIDALSVNKDIAPSAKVSVEITLPSTGPVIFLCSIHPQMKGAFYFT